MSASTSAGSAESRCPLPLGTPGTAAVLSISERSHPGPARGEVNVIEGVVGWPATLANLAAASRVRPFAILAGPRYPSASVESAAPPSVEELRQVVPVSDIRGRLGAGPARCRMAGGYWLPTEAAGSSVSRCEPSNALLPPAARTSERLGLTTCASYPPIGLHGWAASDPDSPLTGSARPFTVLQHAAQTAAPP
jgi:hypothetical protein